MIDGLCCLHLESGQGGISLQGGKMKPKATEACTSSWQRFNKVLETLLRGFGPCCHDSIE